jgi:predicted O-methyltransferase YrrM
LDLLHFYTLIQENPPAFHYWDNKPQVGGLNLSYFQWLESLGGLIGAPGEMVAVETGAGLSTLFFLSASYTLHSFGMPYTIDLLKEFLSSHPQFNSRWFSYSGESEVTLPVFAVSCSDQPASLCFIDGSHAIPAVFSDYCHMNKILKEGGVLIVDDVQLPGPQLLVQMLRQLPRDWKDIGSFSKGVAFQKLHHRPYWPSNMEDMKFTFPD